MSLDFKEYNNRISLILSFLILNSYLISSLNFPIFFLKINLIFFFIITIYFYIKYPKNNLILKIFFFLILLICLGTPAVGWDLRSSFLFHAKRIFLDGSIYSVADNYATFSHNDYPLLLPSFSSSFAFLVGYWHEVFPKSAFTLIYLPPLIFLSSYLSPKKYIVFLSIVLFLVGNHLFNGGVDGVVAVYFICTAYCFFNIFFSEKYISGNNIFFFITIIFSTVLSLLKNEGFVLLLLIFFTTFIFNIELKFLTKTLKKLSILSMSLVPMILWKIFCYRNGIQNTDFSLQYISDNFMDRLVVFENYELFFKYLIVSNEKSIVAILIFVFSFYRNFDKKLFNYSICLFISYLFLLLIVYFSSPYDFNYHLETSAYRVLKSFTLLLSFFGLLNLNLKSLKN